MAVQRGHAVRALLGFAVSGLFLFLLLRQVDLGEVWEAVRGVEVAWLLLAAPAYAAAIWFRGERWRLVLRGAVDIGPGDATSLVVIGYAANNLLPARAGEVIRAVLLHRTHGGSRLTALGTIVVERVFDGLVLVLLLVVGLALAGTNGLLSGLALIGGAGFAFAALVLALLAARPETTSRWLLGLLGVAPARARPAARAWAGSFLTGLSLLRGPRAWALVAGTTALSWGLEAAAYWLVGIGFGLSASPWVYLGVAGAANLAISAPSAAGGVGPFEFFAREVLVVFGATTATATAYALALHALLLGPLTLVGLGLLWRRHIGLGALRRAAGAEAGAAAAAAARVEPAAEALRARQPATGGDGDGA